VRDFGIGPDLKTNQEDSPLKLKSTSLLIAGALFGAAVMPAQANNDAMMDLLEVLRDKGTISAQDYDLLKNAAAADKEASEEVANKVNKVEKEAVSVSLKKGALKLKSGDGAFKAQVGGRVMADYAWIDDDERADRIGDASGDGSELRRARLFMKGTVFNDWKYKMQVGFAGDDVEIKDAYIGYTGFDAVDFTLGNHKMPFSLEEQTSSKYITFMERSLTNDIFSPGRQNGLSAATNGDNWSLKGAVHMDGIDNNNENKDEDYGYGARAHFAPLVDGSNAIHLGVSWHHQEYEEEGLNNGSHGDQRFRARPEIHTVDTRPYLTNIDGVEDDDTIGLEAAGVFGPFSLQAEYFDKSINTETDDVDFDGWYVYGSFFLTGESRAYEADAGEFGRVSPKSTVGNGGYGAWELALRYSEIDLYDSSSAAVTDAGEKGDIFTIGLNWYATRNIRVMANYIDATVEYPGQGISDEDIKAFQLRGQIDF
jgi:phosphate-selective porin OprO/OprP